MIALNIPVSEVIRKRKYIRFLKTHWYTLSDTDRAIHILEETELSFQVDRAQQFLKHYEREYILQINH